MNHYVIICGGRDPDPGTLADVNDVITFLHHFYEGTLRIMHGDAQGVDTQAQQTCDRLGVTVKAFPADWGRGRQAGPERNRKMAELLVAWMAQGHSGEVIAFQGGRGTEHMASFAGQLGINVTRIPDPDPVKAQNVDVGGRVMSNCADGVKQRRRNHPGTHNEQARGLFDDT